MVAYPYYANNDTVHMLAQQAGYQSARAGWIKGKNGKENLFMLKSQEAVNSTNPFSSKPDSE
jgi:predicted RNA binding protein with dsRBD fold (UPF0201 family)